MSTDLADRVSQAAPEPRGPVDVDAIVREGLRRRRRRAGLRALTATLGVAGFAALFTIMAPSPRPAVVLEAPGTSAPTLVAADHWVRVRAGEVLDLPARGWQAFPRAGGEQKVEQPWSPQAEAVVAGWRADGDIDTVTFDTVVGAGGSALFAGNTGPGAVIAGPEGTQRVVAEGLSSIAAAWVPAGGWLLLGRTAENERVLLRATPQGDIVQTHRLSGYPPDVGQLLDVRGDEVWVTAAWEPVDDRGPREAVVARDGGDALVTHVRWQMAPDASATRPDAVASRHPDRVKLPIGDGFAVVRFHAGGDTTKPAWCGSGCQSGRTTTMSARYDSAVTAGDGETYTVQINEFTAPRRRGGALDEGATTELTGSAIPDRSVLVVATADEAWVTALEPRGQDDRVARDPAGRLWLAHADLTGYALSRLHLVG